MEKEVKLTREAIEKLISEEINNMSEQQLQEINPLTGVWSGIKGATGEFGKRISAHGAQARKASYYKEYAGKYIKLANKMNKLVDDMSKVAGKYKIPIVDEKGKANLESKSGQLFDKVRSIAGDAMGEIKSIKSVLSTYDEPSEPIDEPSEPIDEPNIKTVVNDPDAEPTNVPSGEQGLSDDWEDVLPSMRKLPPFEAGGNGGTKGEPSEDIPEPEKELSPRERRKKEREEYRRKFKKERGLPSASGTEDNEDDEFEKAKKASKPWYKRFEEGQKNGTKK